MVNEALLQEVWIIDCDGWRWTIVAEVHEGLALHHEALIHADGVDFLTSKKWVITHVQSGALLGRYPNEERARRALARLSAVKLYGLALGELSGCELCANALVIAARLKSRLSDDEVQRRASFAADVLACAPK